MIKCGKYTNYVLKEVVTEVQEELNSIVLKTVQNKIP